MSGLRRWMACEPSTLSVQLFLLLHIKHFQCGFNFSDIVHAASLVRNSGYQVPKCNACKEGAFRSAVLFLFFCASTVPTESVY